MSDNKSTPKDVYAYDYANKCDCSEDDKCGCSFPNNLSHDFDTHCPQNQENSCAKTVSREKLEIRTPNAHIKKDSVCICSPQECDCTITNSEYTK